MGSGQRAVPGDLAQDVHLDPGIGEPGESRVPEVMVAQALVPELGDDVVPVGGVTQDRGGDTAAPRPGEHAGIRIGAGGQNALGDERLWATAAWRDAPYFTDQERTALALTEAATRIADDHGGVPDDVWNQAADHFDEETLAALVMAIASVNAWNRIDVATRQIAGSYR